MRDEIVKICKKHGELSQQDVEKEKIKYKLRNGEIKESFMLRCSQCRLEKNRKWKLNNPDKHRATASKKRNEDRKLYREGLSNIIPRANIWAQQDRKNNPEKHREWSAKNRKKEGQLRNTREICRRFGLDISYYYDMLKRQNNLCAICHKSETRKSRTKGKICQLAIDHCHKTGKIRELLCHGCNQTIGHAKESIEILEKAISYLKKHSE